MTVKIGNFSRAQHTFDRLKHYVGVRLQQGVPIVDEDWNELEDIRKEELRSFLKWFVGDGVPQGNDGFRIEPIEGRLILTPKQNGFNADEDVLVKKVTIKVLGSTTAELLGFGTADRMAKRAAPPAPQLTSDFAIGEVTFSGANNELKIEVEVPGNPLQAHTHVVTFDAGTYTLSQVLAKINDPALGGQVVAEQGQQDDFNIVGGEHSPGGVGRCLVNGYEVLNEHSIKYSAQALYERGGDFAKSWGAKPLSLYTLPESGVNRTDLIYLDIWEREVATAEDPAHLEHPKVMMSTCVRRKLEWVVRVAEGGTLEDPEDGHAFYELAQWVWQWKHMGGGSPERQLSEQHDLRHRVLEQTKISTRVSSLTNDVYGPDDPLNDNGQPNLQVNLRDAVNALLRREQLQLFTEKRQLTCDAAPDNSPFALEDSNSGIWVFWSRKDIELGNTYSYEMRYNRFNRVSGTWDGESPLPIAQNPTKEPSINIIEDNDRNIWVFWSSELDRNAPGKSEIWYKRYLQNSGGGDWEYEQPLPSAGVEEGCSDVDPCAIVDRNGDIWVFWSSERYGHIDIWCNCYRNGNWNGEINLTEFPLDSLPYSFPDSLPYSFPDSFPEGTYPAKNTHPTVIKNTSRDIWVFWRSSDELNQNQYVWGARFDEDIGDWDIIERLSEDGALIEGFPQVVADDWSIEVVWSAQRNGGWDLYFNRSSGAEWGGESLLRNDVGDDKSPIPVKVIDTEESTWVFWLREENGNRSIWYRRHLSSVHNKNETKLTKETSTMEDRPFAIIDNSGEIWVFFGMQDESGIQNIWYKKTVSTI